MNKLLRVGQIVNTQGIRGEMRIYPLTDYKERFEEIDWVYMGEDTDKKYFIEKVRYKNELVILKLKGIDDINEAEKFKTKYLTIPKAFSRILPEDTYYIVDLIGMEVYTQEHEYLGVLKEVIQSAGNDIYEITYHKNPEKSILIPAVGEFIKEVDMKEKKITVQLIEGFLE
ncbi:ribosome maturation factor RimM [Geosporobacter ferrireducens]|uniref:Ribosome maturation factor RimM n=1 Tax=Geosporobacter ferrireducens TaxID=1424294 RepID=A0A1D8GBV3_9FIRM|nr:ribosome maturation factor RimM [Geosporobacter ferrireducens]AOT68384.1 16S rRNA processing protein RimM [Geosporobacter ferrireducens]MTI53832.1 16S rRNA processing protein RimM [Geosporobacter ferrireducens]